MPQKNAPSKPTVRKKINGPPKSKRVLRGTREEVLRQLADEKMLYLLGLGANMGDCLQNMSSALRGLRRRGALVVARSIVVLSPPMGPVQQPDFFNACAWVGWANGPDTLLLYCMAQEALHKRDRSVHWGPRPLDLDLLWWSGGSVQTDFLTLPHPGLMERDFVLTPAFSLPLFAELTGVSPELENSGLKVMARPEEWGE